MKTLLALALAAAALGGCAVAPYEPAPLVYAAPVPAPVVVARPYYGYYYRPYGYYYRGGPYWRHGWR